MPEAKRSEKLYDGPPPKAGKDLVPLARVERALLAELDFESSASTNSATGARKRTLSLERQRAGSNRPRPPKNRSNQAKACASAPPVGSGPKRFGPAVPPMNMYMIGPAIGTRIHQPDLS